jgi:hypothetical protein
MTNILGKTQDAAKITKRDPKIQPETVIYDPDLLATFPDRFAATSGMNAIAHAVEGLYAVDGNPIVSLMAEEGIHALAHAPPLGEKGHDEALYGAGSAAPSSPASPWCFTTSSATCRAAPSTCPMLKPTRLSCRTPLRTDMKSCLGRMIEHCGRQRGPVHWRSGSSTLRK